MAWLVRKAVSVATIALYVRQRDDEAGTTHIETWQAASGGVEGMTEQRMLDWWRAPRSDNFFGNVRTHTGWVSVADIGADDEEHGAFG